MSRKGIVKMDGWLPQRPPDDVFCSTIRDYVRHAVFSKWNREHQPSSLQEIYRFVQKQIQEDIETGRWPKDWRPPGKRTVDRRVNETADPRFYENGTPKIVSVTAGLYTVNPALFHNDKNGDR